MKKKEQLKKALQNIWDDFKMPILLSFIVSVLVNLLIAILRVKQ